MSDFFVRNTTIGDMEVGNSIGSRRKNTFMSNNNEAYSGETWDKKFVQFRKVGLQYLEADDTRKKSHTFRTTGVQELLNYAGQMRNLLEEYQRTADNKEMQRVFGGDAMRLEKLAGLTMNIERQMLAHEYEDARWQGLSDKITSLTEVLQNVGLFNYEKFIVQLNQSKKQGTGLDDMLIDTYVADVQDALPIDVIDEDDFDKMETELLEEDVVTPSQGDPTVSCGLMSKMSHALRHSTRSSIQSRLSQAATSMTLEVNYEETEPLVSETKGELCSETEGERGSRHVAVGNQFGAPSSSREKSMLPVIVGLFSIIMIIMIIIGAASVYYCMTKKHSTNTYENGALGNYTTDDQRDVKSSNIVPTGLELVLSQDDSSGDGISSSILSMTEHNNTEEVSYSGVFGCEKMFLAGKNPCVKDQLTNIAIRSVLCTVVSCVIGFWCLHHSIPEEFDPSTTIKIDAQSVLNTLASHGLEHIGDLQPPPKHLPVGGFEGNDYKIEFIKNGMTIWKEHYVIYKKEYFEKGKQTYKLDWQDEQHGDQHRKEFLKILDTIEKEIELFTKKKNEAVFPQLYKDWKPSLSKDSETGLYVYQDIVDNNGSLAVMWWPQGYKEDIAKGALPSENFFRYVRNKWEQAKLAK